ncbi:hypothetical protein BGZ54_006561 [Gamsiella multidivaricata]|nr:hypothetical protein BGZ54_006561 [Gamsiella multidivaricata]
MSKAEEWEPRRSVHRQHLQAEQHPSQLQQRADHRAADHLNRPAVSFSTHRSNFRQGVRRTTPRSVPSTDRSSTYLGSRSSSETYRGSEHRVPNRERGHGDGHSYESLSAKKPLLDDEYEGDGNGDGDDINNSDDYDDVVKFLTGARMTKGESLTTFLDRTKTTATPIVPQYVLPKERLITTPSTQAPIAADTEPIYTRDVKTQKTTLISQAELERRMQALRESISESVPPRRPLSMQPTQEKQRRDLATRSGQINRRDLKDGANYPSQQHTPTASQQQRKQASQQHRMEASQHRREALRSRAHRSDLKHKFSSHLQSWNTHTSWPTMSAGESSASDAPYRSNAARRWRMQHTKGTSRRESISGSMPDSSSSIDSEYRDPVKQISGGLSADPTTSALAPIAERKIRRSYCGWIVIRLFRFFLWTLVSMTIQVVVMGILFR